jgi:glutathione S-transferase
MTILYHAAPRLYALKALIALEEKSVTYERRPIRALPLEQAVPGFPAGINQRISVEGEGPVLIDGDTMIVSSFFMLEYIAEAFDGLALLPADPLGQYRAQAVGQQIAGVVAPFVSAIAIARHPLPAVELAGVEPTERRESWAHAASGDLSQIAAHTDRLCTSLARLSVLLGDGQWFAGDYSVADIDAYAMLRDLPALAPGLLEAEPSLAALVARVEARPAVRSALSMSWGDGSATYLPGPEISRWG